MGHVTELAQPKPRRNAIEVDFTAWARSKVEPASARKQYRLAMTADKWLTENRDTSIVWATSKDLKAHLFSCEPDANVRNEVLNALALFIDFLVAKEFTEENPALELPRL